LSKQVSTFPDRFLRLTQRFPAPADAWGVRLLKRAFVAQARRTPQVTRIRFGTIAIDAPLDHPAVYWRYLPPGFNMNYVQVVRRTLEQRGGLVIDVGANIGDGVALLRSAGIDAPILAIEGADPWFELLQRNTASLAGVSTQKALLGDGKNRRQTLAVEKGSGRLVPGGAEIAIVTLDELVAERAAGSVAVLKTDTDGFDARVLFGAKELLESQHPVVFAELDDTMLRAQGNSAEQLLGYLRECGYEWVIAWDNNGRWMDARPLHQGLADLVRQFPGGIATPYLDIAAFVAQDREIAEKISGQRPAAGRAG
jgi:FkbM family methyltransferase